MSPVVVPTLSWGKLILLVVLGAPAVLLGYFSIVNVNHFWEANHPPGGAEVTRTTVTDVDVEEVCGRTSRSTSRCFDDVDGLTFVVDGEVHHADAHTVLNIGDEVEVFQDSDGDWQMKGAFSKGWLVRAGGVTGAAALALGFLAIGQLLSPLRKAS